MRARAISIVVSASFALSFPASGACAQDEGASHVEAPPAPELREPELMAQVHLGAVIPIERTDICPGDSLCVLGGGAIVGVEIERRWPFGLGILVAYDAWFVDSGGVFELGTTLELELTESVAVTFGAQGWLFTTSPFTTTRDRTMRSGGVGLNAALQLNLGLSILAESGVH